MPLSGSSRPGRMREKPITRLLIFRAVYLPERGTSSLHCVSLAKCGGESRTRFAAADSFGTISSLVNKKREKTGEIQSVERISESACRRERAGNPRLRGLYKRSRCSTMLETAIRAARKSRTDARSGSLSMPKSTTTDNIALRLSYFEPATLLELVLEILRVSDVPRVQRRRDSTRLMNVERVTKPFYSRADALSVKNSPFRNNDERPG